MFDTTFTQHRLVSDFSDAMERAISHNFDEISTANLNKKAEQIIIATRQVYESVFETFQESKGVQIKSFGKSCWAVLIKYIERYISAYKSNVKILDVGTGNGRDMIYGQGLGYNMYGTDNCDGFMKILSQHCKAGLIKNNTCRQCDMRKLDFDDCVFDVVRHNATLLHMPIIKENYTADLAVSEANRVLKPNGLLFVTVKYGNKLEVIDTGENLGCRIFQLYSHEALNDIIERNGFTIVYTSDEDEERNGVKIDWIILIAQKRKD